jgi:hypothetical protein
MAAGYLGKGTTCKLRGPPAGGAFLGLRHWRTWESISGPDGIVSEFLDVTNQSTTGKYRSPSSLA